jgi:hypothetical protein
MAGLGGVDVTSAWNPALSSQVVPGATQEQGPHKATAPKMADRTSLTMG